MNLRNGRNYGKKRREEEKKKMYIQYLYVKFSRNNEKDMSKPMSVIRCVQGWQLRPFWIIQMAENSKTKEDGPCQKLMWKQKQRLRWYGHRPRSAQSHQKLQLASKDAAQSLRRKHDSANTEILAQRIN